jgi:hypothetical protein
MRRINVFVIVIAILLVIVQRLPAPIEELSQTATPKATIRPIQKQSAPEATKIRAKPSALSSVLSQPSPIEVKFYPHPAYPIVVPKNMAWMAQDPSEAQPGPSRGGSGGSRSMATAIGKATVPITGNTDRRKLFIELAQIASTNGANAINYKFDGNQLRVKFLHVHDGYLPRSPDRSSLPSH